jgi:Arc/MetJ family transcription regulator
MSRTNVDIDDEACERVMAMYRLQTKREAINLALRKLAYPPMTKEEALAMEGTGWGWVGEEDPQDLSGLDVHER